MRRRGLLQGCVVDTQGRVLLSHVVVPRGFWQRLRGLIGRAPLGEHEGWWFEDCHAVHTLGLRVPIDVLHLSSQGAILRIVPAVAPCRYSACVRATRVLELRAGAALALGLRHGQRLEFRG